MPEPAHLSAGTSQTRSPRGAAALALVMFLGLASSGCLYNGHRTMGATEKIEASDVNFVTKIGGVFFVSLGDSIIAPAEMIVDQTFIEPPYHPEHRYLSYAGTRTVARSDMGLGYQGMASVWSLVVETIYLPVTGTIDLVSILALGHSDPPPSETEQLMASVR